MISERTLKKWRADSLKQLKNPSCPNEKEQNERILRLTQELLDQHLLRK